MSRTLALVTAARPKQWIKNFFLFAPLLFSRHLFELQTISLSAIGFLLFSLAASCIYLFNDVIDREKDKLHPVKSKRPIASGLLPITWVVVAVCITVPIVAIIALSVDVHFGIALCGYLLLNTIYTLFLKEVVIIDVMTIAASFVLRIVSGALIIEVPISEWLLICTSLLALFLGFSKRRHEITVMEHKAHDHRPVLLEYSTYFLDQMTSLVTAATLISYILYTVAEETVTKFHSKNLLITSPFVLYGLFRYLYLIHQKQSGGDPTTELMSDKPLLADIALWAIAVAIIIYTR